MDNPAEIWKKKPSPYLVAQWWKDTLGGLFEESAWEGSWGSIDMNMLSKHWYRSGDMLIGYWMLKDRTRPIFFFVWRPWERGSLDRMVRKTFEFWDAQAFMMFLQALKDRSQMPCCMGLGWCDTLVEAVLKG